MIGYSGGGQLVLNTAELLDGKVKIDTAILIGSPVEELNVSNIGTVVSIWSAADPLSWAASWGVINECMGWISHLGYFEGDNLTKLLETINKYIGPGECS